MTYRQVWLRNRAALLAGGALLLALGLAAVRSYGPTLGGALDALLLVLLYELDRVLALVRRWHREEITTRAAAAPWREGLG